jgi:hypothetical protein
VTKLPPKYEGLVKSITNSNVFIFQFLRENPLIVVFGIGWIITVQKEIKPLSLSRSFCLHYQLKIYIARISLNIT